MALSMKVLAKNNRMEKIMKTESALIREYGRDSARKIMQRIAELKNAENLYEVASLRYTGLHLLSQDRKGQWALKLNANRRMTITAYETQEGDELSGNEYLKSIKTVIIEELCIDYH